MNPSASLIASSVIFNAGSENFGAITSADVIFNDSANSGSVIGNALFNGSAINRVAGLVSGNAIFAATATNLGTVQGTVTIDDSAYAAWLTANAGVTQYTGAGPHNGQWAYNSTEYASQADAQAAYDAANGGGGGGDTLWTGQAGDGSGTQCDVYTAESILAVGSRVTAFIFAGTLYTYGVNYSSSGGFISNSDNNIYTWGSNGVISGVQNR